MIVEYSTLDNGEVLIHTFERKPDRTRVHKKISNFFPYFYLPAERIVEEDPRILSVQQGFKSLYGEPLQKIVVSHPKDIYEFREKYPEAQEANVLFNARYLIDCVDKIPDVKPRKLWFDIETEDEYGLPDFNKPDQKILSIAFVDSFENKNTVFILGNEGAAGMRTTEIPIKNKSPIKVNYEVFSFQNEKEMLSSFVKKVAFLDPDYLLGWNTRGERVNNKFNAGFDLPYLFARCKKLGVWFNGISPINECDLSDEGEIRIKGRECPELMIVYKLLKLKESDLTLEEVSKKELKAKKVVAEGISDLWTFNPEKLCEYNIVDVVLVRMLDEKLGLSDQAFQMSRISYSRAEDMGNEVTMIRHACLRKCKEWGVVFPTQHAEKKAFAGGFVFPVKTGVHQNVISLDIESMYPNSIRAFNISPETIVKEGGVLLPSGVRFKQNCRALLPAVIEDYYENRIHYKRLSEQETNKEIKAILKSKSNSFKALNNAVFGVVIHLFGVDVAKSITLTSQEVIKFINEKVNADGFESVFGDTDSNGIIKKNLSFDEAIEAGKEEAKKINESFEEFMKRFGLTNQKPNGDRHYKIKFEKVYSRGFWSVKKSGEGAMKRRFCWVAWEDGRKLNKPYLETKGFEAIKSGFSPMYKEVQNNVLMMVCPPEGEPRSKEEIDEWLLSKVDEITALPADFITGDIKITELPVQYFKDKRDWTSNNPKRRGLLYSLNYLGLKLQAGKRYKLGYVKSVPDNYPQEIEMDVLTHKYEIKEDGTKTVISDIKRNTYPANVIIYEGGKFPSGFELDIEKYVDLNVASPVEGIYAAFGWDTPFKKERKTKGKRTKKEEKPITTLANWGAF